MFIQKLFNPQKRKKAKQVQDLIIKAEMSVRQLSGLSPVYHDLSADIDLISVLNSVNLLLDRLVANPEFIKASPDLLPEKQIITEEETPIIEIPDITEEETPTLEIPDIPQEPQLSETAKELIKLRDWVLLAKTGHTTPSYELLDVLYQQLAQLLEKEGVTPLEDNGKFNYEYQQIMSTKVTHEEKDNDIVCETVRPGYLFNDGVVRQQEVIIYVFKPLETQEKEGTDDN